MLIFTDDDDDGDGIEDAKDNGEKRERKKSTAGVHEMRLLHRHLLYLCL